MSNKITAFIFFIVGIWILIWIGNKITPVEPEIKEVFVYKTDTIEVLVPKPSFEVRYRDTVIFETDTFYIEVPQDVDTAKILRDYFAKRHYEGNILSDSTLTIDYKAMVEQNTLKELSVSYELNYLQTTVTHQNKNQLFVSVMMAQYPNLNLKFQPKNSKFMFGVGVEKSPNPPHIVGEISYNIWRF